MEDSVSLVKFNKPVEKGPDLKMGILTHLGVPEHLGVQTESLMNSEWDIHNNNYIFRRQFCTFVENISNSRKFIVNLKINTY